MAWHGMALYGLVWQSEAIWRDFVAAPLPRPFLSRLLSPNISSSPRLAILCRHVLSSVLLYRRAAVVRLEGVFPGNL